MDIVIKGARVNNLKNINVNIPRYSITVITGVSGSGKTSLAHDTIYAEGQRRYIESLSSYIRQFLSQTTKPDVDIIEGISPTILVEQKVTSRNPRSTVGTSTEIYDYLKLLFASIGKVISPISGNIVKRYTPDEIINELLLNNVNDNIIICFKPTYAITKNNFKQYLSFLNSEGYSRIEINNNIFFISDIVNNLTVPNIKNNIHVIVDQLTVNNNDEFYNRAFSSIETAMNESDGYCHIIINNKQIKVYSNKFELDNIQFKEPSVNIFNFNSPLGACPTCQGFGNIIGIDEDLVIPNKSLSIYDNAIAPWRTENFIEWKNNLILKAHKIDFPIHKPYIELTDREKQILWNGCKYFHGINQFFKYIEEHSYKIQNRILLYRYRGKTICPECNGSRLRKEASYIYVDKYKITDLINIPVSKLYDIILNLKLNNHEATIAQRLLFEIKSRLELLLKVGLGYLTLDRLSSSLSGGESQRINIVKSIGSGLVDAIYVLDEPSIGMHPRDIKNLLQVLIKLRDTGNTLIVVEHDETIIRNADHIIDIGPMAGTNGGRIVAEGSITDILNSHNSITAQYLNNIKVIPKPKYYRKPHSFISIEKAFENNLKYIDVKIPLNVITVVTGVSGSGKSSLIKNVLYGNVKKKLGETAEKVGKCYNIQFDPASITNIEMIDQNPIGKSSRSNPATYIKAFDDIRTLFSEQKLAKTRGYKPSLFSFNIDGGRCDACKGEGEITIEMQFMPDVKIKCDECNGSRYKNFILEITYKNKNISDILNLTIDEAIQLFSENNNKNSIENKIIEKLTVLQQIGLGYLKLGQSSSTISGGEAQRIKLASFLTKKDSSEKIMFIFDEPSTGLHFNDINNLMFAINSLIDYGHSVIIIEHNLDIIKCADYIIDLGPEGGENGGEIIFQGTPTDIVNCPNSYTGKYLKEKLLNAT